MCRRAPSWGLFCSLFIFLPSVKLFRVLVFHISNMPMMRNSTSASKLVVSLRHIRRSLTDDMAKLIAVALVQSRLDYCNSLLFGVSQFNLDKLQRVQNLAARLALNDWRSPIPHLFVKLHWLPIHSRIKFKISSLTFKLLSDNQPANLRSLLTPYAPPRLLRSSDKCLLTQPRTSTSIGKRAFNVLLIASTMMSSVLSFDFIIDSDMSYVIL